MPTSAFTASSPRRWCWPTTSRSRPSRGWSPSPSTPASAACYKIIRAHPLIVGLKARQIGWTWGLALYALWECLAYPVGETGVFTLDQDEANLFVWRVKRLYGTAPEWLQKTFPVKTDKADTFAIKHREGVSGVVAFPASGEGGRGRTFRTVIADERARWSAKMGAHAAAMRMAAIRPAVAQGGKMIEVSTAAGYDAHYETVMGAVERRPGPHDGQRLRALLRQRPRPARAAPTRAWPPTARVSIATSPASGPRSCPSRSPRPSAPRGSASSHKDALDDLLEHSARPPIGRFDLRAHAGTIVADPHVSGQWAVWQWPLAGRDYLLGADSSGGGASSDYSYAALYDGTSWDQVAAFHGRPEPRDFARQLIRAGWLWAGPAGPALLAPERNNHGEGVVATLLERRYPRVYVQERFDQRSGQLSRTYGYLQTAHTRRVAIAALQAAASDGSLGIRDAEAIVEMSRFVDPGDGKPRAEDGSHDDRVIATAIVAALLSFARAGRPSRARASDSYAPRISERTGY